MPIGRQETVFEEGGGDVFQTDFSALPAFDANLKIRGLKLRV
jgi:hypothetical protein